MTDKEKAKAYDEAVERARKLESPFYKQAAEIIFPTLAESEDERIRKKLHEVICRSINDPNIPYKERDYISKSVLPYVEKLEKQKEQKPFSDGENNIIITKEEYNRLKKPAEWSEEDEQVISAMIRDYESEIAVWEHKEIESGKSAQKQINTYKGFISFIKALRPQPKQEWSEEDEKTIKWAYDVIRRIGEGTDPQISKECAARLATKLKSLPNRIVSENKEKPVISNEAIREGVAHFGITQYQIDNWLKKHINVVEQEPATEWTIENAKPGDILHTWSTANSDTFIFKEITDGGIVKCYCSYDSEDGFREGQYHYIGRKEDKYTLATPEQCIELGRRMGRAGYLFDFKTKELIRWESKRELIEWNEEDEKMLQFYLDECEYKHDYWPNKDRVEMLEKFKDWLINRAKYFAKPKHEWTDDDNKMAEAMQNCIDELVIGYGWNYAYAGDDSVLLSNLKDWINKLRERV